MHYKGLTLDKFQEQAIESIEKNNSVVVSAPTGSGKTLIADYIIDRDIKKHKKVIYTAPIKALSNQKYKQFIHAYSEENIGILTGDVVINPAALVLIMTTEVYRNMLLVNDPILQNISYVIFDEIHFINDVERGYVWEESIIFSPENIRFLCLSATIPNYQQFADWIHSIKHHKVDVVKHHKRPVPLTHKFYDQELGITNLTDIREKAELDKYGEYKTLMKGRFRRSFVNPPNHIDLIKILKNKELFPAIYFVFSRKAAQTKAEALSKKFDLLSSSEKKQVVEIVSTKFKTVDHEIKLLQTTKLVRNLLSKGIGVHHAGLLPVLKELVETLFEKGLIKMLFATETFAVGINMPAKVVCFNSLEKYDGRNFRYLSPKEYFQLAGRAGRRGIDKKGLAISMVHRAYDDLKKIKSLTSEDKEPIISHFKISYNTILNMIHNFSEQEIKNLLKSNFGFFQKYGLSGLKDKRKQTALWANYCKKKKVLERNNFVTNNLLTNKGYFATKIYSNEMLITELFYESFHNDLDEYQILLLILSIVYEPRRGVKFKKSHERFSQADKLVKKLIRNTYFKTTINFTAISNLQFLLWRWYHNCSFAELTEYTNLLEGDIIRLFRQSIDVLSQIRKASTDNYLNQKIDNCIQLLNRDVIQVRFE